MRKPCLRNRQLEHLAWRWVRKSLVSRSFAWLFSKWQATFYLLFSFLFGYSLTYQRQDSDAARQRAFQRRLIGLGALGALHATLFLSATL
jgi:uncharacterized membrane protein YeiB